MSSQREKEINLTAKRALFKYLKYAQAASGGTVDPEDLLPISPETVAKILGIQVVVEDQLLHQNPFSETTRTAGVYAKSSDTIVVPSLRTNERRFSLAHELGHRELQHEAERSFRDRTSRYVESPRNEWEANLFAASLLMPEKLVVAKWADRFVGCIEIAHIDDDAAFELTSGRLSASALRRKPPVEVAEFFARATWFRGRQFDPLITVFGVSAEAMARRVIYLKLLR